MSVYYFPGGDPDFTGVISYSPMQKVVCPQKPFGQVSAEEYLQFARADLATGDRHGFVNALGNAKRCFHYHVDVLLYRLGIRPATSDSDFPTKLDILKELRIASGTLLRVFNRERNAMEHDYSTPTREIAEGAIDLCELFLEATARYLTGIPAKIRVVLADDERDLILGLEPNSDRVQKYVVHGTTAELTEHGKIYKESIFEFFKETLREGISIEPKPNEDIVLTLRNKEVWIPIIRMFCSVVNEHTSHRKYPEEPMVTMSHDIPLKLAQEAFLHVERKKGQRRSRQE